MKTIILNTLLLFYYGCYHIGTQLLSSHKTENVEKRQRDIDKEYDWARYNKCSE